MNISRNRLPEGGLFLLDVRIAFIKVCRYFAAVLVYITENV